MSVNLKVAYCDYEAAKYAVLNWHYSNRMPKFKQSFLGVWEDERFVGAVLFGRSATPFLGDAYGLKTTECIELTRIALRKHETPVSRIVAIAIRMIKRSSPGLRLVVSYADLNVGHHGGIYQAGNWVYVGGSAKVKQFFFRGSWRNDSSLMRFLKANPAAKKTLNVRSLVAKHKYLYPLDEEMRLLIEPLRKPYPKRAGSLESEAPEFHSGEGRANRTPALKHEEKKTKEKTHRRGRRRRAA